MRILASKKSEGNCRITKDAQCGRMANGLFKASLEWVGRGRGLPEVGMGAIFVLMVGGEGGRLLSQVGLNNQIVSENSFQFHNPVSP